MFQLIDPKWLVCFSFALIEIVVFKIEITVAYLEFKFLVIPTIPLDEITAKSDSKLSCIPLFIKSVLFAFS